MLRVEVEKCREKPITKAGKSEILVGSLDFADAIELMQPLTVRNRDNGDNRNNRGI